MSPKQDLDSLRELCRDQSAFQRLKQFLAEREILYQQFSTQIAQQMQKNQELAAQQQAAEVASQAKSQFLAMMSHELRTPLNAILGLSTVLYQQMIGDLNPKQIEYLACIHESGEHLLALISDILDLSKIEAGQEHLTLSEVAVSPLCQSCVAMVEPKATAKALGLSCAIDPSLAVCVADERRLRQMLLNLLTNAVKFTQVGQVTLTVRQQGSMVQFEVEDTGIGIPPERRGHLFQPFAQLDSNLNRHYEGTGLGLALTQQLAQLHGGYLTVESEVGKGSRFLLYLPLDARLGGSLQVAPPPLSLAPEAPAPAVIAPDRSQSPPPQVGDNPPLAANQPASSGLWSLPQTTPALVLFDANFDRHQALMTYVKTCGWNLLPLSSWAEVLTQIHHNPPRLLVMGPQIPAVELSPYLRHLRQMPSARWIKVVVMQDQPASPSPDLEADAYLALPLTIPKLERILSL